MNRGRLFGAIVSVVAIVATAAPVVRDPQDDDSFPLSTYPMFAQRRGTTQSFEYAVAWTAGRERRPLKPRHVVDTGEVMDARMTFSNAVGKKKLPDLCKAIAARVARDDDLADVTRIEIVRGKHDAVDYLVRGIHGEEKTLTSCEVVR